MCNDCFIDLTLLTIVFVRLLLLLVCLGLRRFTRCFEDSESGDDVTTFFESTPCSLASVFELFCDSVDVRWLSTTLVYLV